MKTRMRRIVALLVCAAATLVGVGSTLISSSASAATHDDGCHVWAWAPTYMNGHVEYGGQTRCKHYEYALTQYIGNEYFRHPSDDQPAWSGSAKRTCGPNTVKTCQVTSRGPYKGPGLYCTVAMTDLWFVNRIESRTCTTMG